jgi:hypothetical protein
MEMIIMQVRNEDVIKAGKLCEIKVDFRIMPPAAKI